MRSLPAKRDARLEFNFILIKFSHRERVDSTRVESSVQRLDATSRGSSDELLTGRGEHVRKVLKSRKSWLGLALGGAAISWEAAPRKKHINSHFGLLMIIHTAAQPQVLCGEIMR